MKKARMIAAVMIGVLVLGAVAAWADDNVLGLWKIIDDKSGKPNAYVFLYMYNGKMYGRMVATISLETGLIDDTMATKTFKAKSLAGEPPNCGLDFVYELTERGKDWKGAIIDPNDGKVYDCTIKRDGNKLIVRGSLRGTGGLLGRNQTWLLANASELPAEFKLPDAKTFVPVIPKGK